jgi:hypothetical protein
VFIDEIILLLIIISTIKCVGYFDRGLKEMIIKQKEFESKKIVYENLRSNLIRSSL